MLPIKTGATLILMCLIVSASAEWAPIKCGQAKFYLSGLIELEERLYREEGLWSCGVPRLRAREAVVQACKSYFPKGLYLVNVDKGRNETYGN
jgi:hypothetical protein